VVGALVVLTACSHENDARHARPVPAPVTTAATPSVLVDLDGDGVEEAVRHGDRRVEVTLSGSGRTVSHWVGRVADFSGVAEVDGRRAITVGSYALAVDERGRLRPLELGWFPTPYVWADGAGRLLSGYAHDDRGMTYVATYHWPRTGTDARPVPVEMHCVTDGRPTPRSCGTGTFVGSPAGLPRLRPVLDAPWMSVGEEPYAAPLPVGGTVDVRLVRDAPTGATLEVGAARLSLPDDGDSTTVLRRTALDHDGDLVLVAAQSAGDSSTYLVVRYDGATLRRVPVEGSDGWRLGAGGPAAGGPATDTWLTADQRLFTARSEVGAIVYEQLVEWVWDGDRLISRPLPAPVCLDDLGVTETYGDCGLR
jgi:hypothetical protein